MYIIPSKDQNTTKWSGGLTTELFIFPQHSTYAERNFNFRLSTATVDVQTSVFTPLPNVQRTLMVLKGRMELVHEGQHRQVLEALEVDEFYGGWKTSSYGTCVDFNLMCMNGTTGSVEGLVLEKDELMEFDCQTNQCFIFLYEGELIINDIPVEEGSLVVLNNSSVSILSKERSTIVRIHII